MLFKIHLVPSYHNNNLKLQNEFYLYPLIIPSSRGLLEREAVEYAGYKYMVDLHWFALQIRHFYFKNLISIVR